MQCTSASKKVATQKQFQWHHIVWLLLVLWYIWPLFRGWQGLVQSWYWCWQTAKTNHGIRGNRYTAQTSISPPMLGRPGNQTMCVLLRQEIKMLHFNWSTDFYVHPTYLWLLRHDYFQCKPRLGINHILTIQNSSNCKPRLGTPVYWTDHES